MRSVGGDEVQTGCYNLSTITTEWFAANSSRTYDDLLQFWVDTALPIFTSSAKKDRRLIMWEDVAIGTPQAHSVPTDIIMQTWNLGLENIKKLTSSGYDVIVSSADWGVIRDNIIYEWESDSHFAELQQATMMRERLGTLVNDMGYRDEVVGKYFSQEYINKHVLKLSQEEIDNMKEQIAAEKEEAGGGESEDQQWEFDPSANKPDLKVISN